MLCFFLLLLLTIKNGIVAVQCGLRQWLWLCVHHYGSTIIMDLSRKIMSFNERKKSSSWKSFVFTRRLSISFVNTYTFNWNLFKIGAMNLKMFKRQLRANVRNNLIFLLLWTLSFYSASSHSSRQLFTHIMI